MPLLPLMLATALATDDPALDRHLELAEQAMRAESRGDYDVAWRDCTAAIDLLPAGPRVPRCLRRLEHLDARRDADGTFTSWGALEAIRRNARFEDPDRSRLAVIELLSREGVSSTTRVDATLWLANDAMDRRRDLEGALALTSVAWAERDQLEHALRLRAVLTHAKVLAELDRHDEAAAVEAEVRVDAPSPRLTPVERISRRQTHGRWTLVAWSSLSVFVLLSAPLALRGARTGGVPLGLVPLWAGLFATRVLAERWEEGAGASLGWMMLGFGVVHVLTAWARVSDGGAPWKAAVSLGAAVATLAVAWLALAATGGLDWVGL